MKVYWLDGGLRLEPETSEDEKRIAAIEAAIRALEGVTIQAPLGETGFSSPELHQIFVGSASKFL